ncbi:hypothetical protein H9Q10_02745 [Eikenella sp. S3360]|uniref:Lipoprotein n=1 Tax=Eikenella glucosivorans TaxID=2766967 RepID=A0ABS0N8I7_9NEIS|nr:hypothetical protein [Eikenella glucosivorans]MBH5328589.1 hypothetical protein [Eikenella glucosivorans]
MKQHLLALALISVLAACGGQNNGSAPAASAPAQPASEASAASVAEQPAAPAAADLDPILADPQVGDLYAAKLSDFSAADFGDNKGREQEVSYGLMKVVEVQPDRLIVITEDAAWDNPRGARNDLNGDLADITWDESERIPVKRADLAKLVADGSILETRRLDK